MKSVLSGHATCLLTAGALACGGGALGLVSCGSADGRADDHQVTDAAADQTVLASDAEAIDAATSASSSQDALGDAPYAALDAQGLGDGRDVSATPVDAASPDSAVFAPLDAGPLASGAFTVNLAKTFGPVTRLMYGHNWLTPAQTAWNTVGRFGGNPLSVFNWSKDYYNAAADYYFKSMPLAWSNYPNWEDFVDAGQATSTMLFVVPTLGWVAQSHVACTYPFSKWPNQQDYEHTYANPDGGAALPCNSDPSAGAACCGNGKDKAGALLDASVDLDASYVRSGPSDVVAWLQAIKAKLGDGAFARVVVGLDNEPDWWNQTHPDVHPLQATVAEIWDKNRTYATAIKTAFPSTPILGLDLVAWYNTADIQTYLTDVGAYKTEHGIQLIDYLDLHFYPAYSTFAFGCDQVPTAQRLQSPRMLWDPTYLNPYDGLPANQAPQLIPRYKTMIASTPGASGVKLALSEYNLGTDACAAGAVAQAEAFAAFGRYGLDLATRWSDSGYGGHYALTAGSPVESAFRMFLEHDVTGTSVEVIAAAGKSGFTPDQVTVFAVANGTTLDVLLFNKQATAQKVSVQFGAATATASAAYQFSTANPQIAAVSTPSLSGGLAAMALPAQSATLVVASLR